MKTGTNTGIIINTRGKKHYCITKKKDEEKKKRAKICIRCEFKGDGGWCKKYKEWGYKVNYICLGIEDPYKKFNNGYNWNKNNKYKKKNNKKTKFKSKKKR
ncbi:hypothetical protein QIT93_05340 [Clostridium baratii]|uniref:hypothetical protein n=1 Tax=Clostridium baratii TaxID=1561 RepID=UPI0030D18715